MAILYFITFFLIFSLIFLNLFIAIILSGFDDTNNTEDCTLNQDLLDHFRNVWAGFDPEGSCYLEIPDFTDLLYKLGPPLGWDSTFKNNLGRRNSFLKDMELPTYNNRSNFGYFDVLNFLSKKQLVQAHQKRILKN